VTVDILKEELKELSTSLREERWHSDDLKKELDNLQESLKKDGEGKGETVPHVSDSYFQYYFSYNVIKECS